MRHDGLRGYRNFKDRQMRPDLAGFNAAEVWRSPDSRVKSTTLESRLRKLEVSRRR